MRKDFCDRCNEQINNPTMVNRVQMPDNICIDLCSGCQTSLGELVRKWRNAFALEK